MTPGDMQDPTDAGPATAQDRRDLRIERGLFLVAGIIAGLLCGQAVRLAGTSLAGDIVGRSLGNGVGLSIVVAFSGGYPKLTARSGAALLATGVAMGFAGTWLRVALATEPSDAPGATPSARDGGDRGSPFRSYLRWLPKGFALGAVLVAVITLATHPLLESRARQALAQAAMMSATFLDWSRWREVRPWGAVLLLGVITALSFAVVYILPQ